MARMRKRDHHRQVMVTHAHRQRLPRASAEGCVGMMTDAVFISRASLQGHAVLLRPEAYLLLRLPLLLDVLQPLLDLLDLLSGGVRGL